MLPEKPPATLLLAGWYDPALGAQLADHAALVRAAEASGGPHPRLVIGPWSHGALAHKSFRRSNGFARVALREALDFLDGTLGDGTRPSGASVRYFLAGAGSWAMAEAWPAEDVESRRLYLHGAGATTGRRLEWRDAAQDDPGASLHGDPDQPVPSVGGGVLGRASAVCDQAVLASRTDVLDYVTEPLRERLELRGEARLVLHLSADVPDCDVCAKLVDVAADGASLNVCDGITRARWRGAEDTQTDPRWLEPNELVELVVELGAFAWRLDVGHRLQLILSASDVPRYDRNPGTRDEPASASPETSRASTLRILHDAGHPSHLVLPVAPRASR